MIGLEPLFGEEHEIFREATRRFVEKEIEVQENRLIVNNEPVKRTFLRKEVTGDYMFPYEILEREVN